MKNHKILIAGAGGFIGGHLVKRLLEQNNSICAVDIKSKEHWFQIHDQASNLDTFDCRINDNFEKIKNIKFDLVINLACDHGGVGYLINNDYRNLTDVTINLNLLNFAITKKIKKYLFASSACVYNKSLQEDINNIVSLRESDAWPANPDMLYGFEKLYSEEVCRSAQATHNIKVYIPRIHGCYGPHNHYNNIKEKAPNALARKALNDKFIEVWGSGKQLRSFMFIDDAVTGIIKLLNSEYHQPINLGSSKTVSMTQVAEIANNIVGLGKEIRYVTGTVGVNARTSDNTLIRKVLGWEPEIDITTGLTRTIEWLKTKNG